MTKTERKWMDRVARLGCVVCRNVHPPESPAELHHIREGQGAAQRAKNFLVIPLCPAHHRSGGEGVAYHAGQRTWESLYGSELDLLAQTIGELA